MLEDAVASIPALNLEWRERAVAHLNNLTKPLGSLGRLEEIAARLVMIRERERPECSNPAIFTLAADHGVTEEGVSAYPKAVTRQMVLNFLSGGAAINVLGCHCGVEVIVVDIGVDGEFGDVAGLVKMKVAPGTRNMALGPAMSEAELTSALNAGLELAALAHKQGRSLIGTGEMGIGNTTAASAVTSVLTGRPVAEVTGRGTGLDHAGIQHKTQVIEHALALNRPNPSDPLDVLLKVGGLEIAGITGLILGAAAHRISVVVDGFISTSAAAVACAIQPRVSDFIFAAHLSSEPGHSTLLELIRQQPLLDLDMRLGEGTGAALAMNIIAAAAKVYNEMATFSSAGVSGAPA
ncbi:MAG: nicotinate-nucleotide--dimethylbenzimidazole phosphoribosyltransferase [Acidobacteriota bacterium]|nr:nicotinate-nucleotide--dimethylbenzimidazole phosphoribosyltransferase [Acidobacteriota bacterium]